MNRPTRKIMQMQKCNLMWNTQTEPQRSFYIQNHYLDSKSNSSIVSEYYSNIARRHIFNQYGHYDCVLKCHIGISDNPRILNFIFNEMIEFRDKMIEIGFKLRQSAYNSIPSSIPGAYNTDKMNHILASKPEEYSEIINNFYIGLTFSAEAIACYADFLYKHKGILKVIGLSFTIEQEISLLKKIALRDVDEEKIQIKAIPTKKAKTKKQEEQTDCATSIEAIRKCVNIICINEKSIAIWEKILSNNNAINALTTYSGSYHKIIGFNFRLVLCIFGVMHDKGIITISEYKDKAAIFKELKKHYTLNNSQNNYLSKKINSAFKDVQTRKFLMKTIK